MNTQRATQVKLCQKFKHVHIITNKDELIRHLDEKPVIPILKFIVSSEQAASLCHLVKDKSRNYDVYELDTKLPQSIKKNSNTWSTFNNIEELLQTIYKESDITVDKNKIISDDEEYINRSFLPPLGIFNSSSISKLFHVLNKESSTFLLFQLLNKIIIEMQHSSEDLNDMWFFCRKKYDAYKTQLRNIEELAKSYLPTEAIRYYTESSFLHRSLNEVFRREDTDDIYEFRSYISDLHGQLKSLGDELKLTRQSNKITIYRGRTLSLIVLQQLKNLYKSKDMKDKLISINGFLSTTRKKKIAKFFAGVGEKRDGYESVIFKMHIDRKINHQIPYAYIADTKSAMPDEKEVLFSMGSVWRLASVKRNKAAVWTIVLRLCNVFDAKLTELREQILINQSSYDYHLFLLAKISHALGKYPQAGRFYYSLLEKKLSNDFKNLIYFNLATMKGEQGDYQEAQNYYEKILETRTTNETNSLGPTCAITRISSRMIIMYKIGLLQEKKRERSKARNSFKNALNEQGLSIEKAVVHNKLGNFEKLCGNLNDALVHLKKAVELAENSEWSSRFKQDLENVEHSL
jgi:tetratricopeptide (TPR) repeat protein